MDNQNKIGINKNYDEVNLLFCKIDLLENDLSDNINCFKKILDEDPKNIYLLISKVYIKLIIQNAEKEIWFLCKYCQDNTIIKLNKKIKILEDRNKQINNIVNNGIVFNGNVSVGILNRLMQKLCSEEKINNIISDNKCLTKQYYLKNEIFW